MEIFTDGSFNGFRRRGRGIRTLCAIVLLALILPCIRVSAAETAEGEAESVLQWITEKAADEELDIGDEESIEQAIAEGEEKFGVTLTDNEKEKIITVLQKIDSIGLNAEEMLEQAKELYHKYGTEVVLEANEAIDEAVEGAVESVKKSFVASLKEAVQGFFKNLFS